MVHIIIYHRTPQKMLMINANEWNTWRENETHGNYVTAPSYCRDTGKVLQLLHAKAAHWVTNNITSINMLWKQSSDCSNEWKAECCCIAAGVMCYTEKICAVQTVQGDLWSQEVTANSWLMVQCYDTHTALCKWKAEWCCIAAVVMCYTEKICAVQTVQGDLWSQEGTANSWLMVWCSDTHTALCKWKAECCCIAAVVMCYTEKICAVQTVQGDLWSQEGTANSWLLMQCSDTHTAFCKLHLVT